MTFTANFKLIYQRSRTSNYFIVKLFKEEHGNICFGCPFKSQRQVLQSSAATSRWRPTFPPVFSALIPIQKMNVGETNE